MRWVHILRQALWPEHVVPGNMRSTRPPNRDHNHGHADFREDAHLIEMQPVCRADQHVKGDT